ncbi:carbohydrate kinase [Dactylosporangium sp. NPDC051485]|uniref:carbohydrate kinase family protein n=1 Tax=Dactylosporangium sp. NPDC051485 TaxID=3154846 RepID=UPI0034154708
MSRPALAIGEALVDVIDSRNGSMIRPGGSPANVAIGLARLGVPTELLTALADDTYGELVKAWVEDSGVGVERNSACLDRTSIARAVLDAGGAARYELDIVWTLPAVPRTAIADRPLVHVGSLALFLEPGANEVERIVEHAVSTDVPVAVDANIRPSALTDPASARARFESIAERATVVKLSDEDAAYLYPDVADHDVVRHLHELGGATPAARRVVALTLGASGALLRCADGDVRTTAPRVSVVDTIGAGDSFMSGMLARLLKYKRSAWQELSTVVDVGRYAAQCAAITVGREGADPPRWNEVVAP